MGAVQVHPGTDDWRIQSLHFAEDEFSGDHTNKRPTLLTAFEAFVNNCNKRG